MWFYSLKIEYLVFCISLTVPAQGDEVCATLMRRTPHLKRRTPHLRRRTPHLRRRTPPRWSSRLLTCTVWFRFPFLCISGIFLVYFLYIIFFKVCFWCVLHDLMLYLLDVINMILVVYYIYFYMKWIFDVKLPYCPLCV